jgi:hypothetical protein
MKIVVAKQERQDSDDHQADRHAQCESEDVEDGKESISREIAQGGFQIVTEHRVEM